jgi:hypothetical protein
LFKAVCAAKYSVCQRGRDFKHQDTLNFPKPGGFLFIGSSSIRLWADLEQRFSAAPIIKRGVGGSELSQWVAYYAPDLIYPYKPAKIYVYAGDNDIAAGKPAKNVAADFAKLWGMIQRTAIVGPICYIVAAGASFINVYISFCFILGAMVFYIFFSGKNKVEERMIIAAKKEIS